MVKLLNRQENERIEQAIAEAERHTNAEIIVVVAPASDSYLDFILLYGILLSTLVNAGLWITQTLTNYADLLPIQLGILLLLSFLPPLRRLCWQLVPKRILHQRSIRCALEEYHTVYRQLPAAAPLVLLFISVGERYAHIIASHAVQEKIRNDYWTTLIQTFAAARSQHGLAQACLSTIKNMGETLTPHFPESGESYGFSNQIIERD